MENFFLVIVALALVALNGFFVAAEFGLVKLRATRVRALLKQGGLRSRILAKMHGHLDNYLSACQLGITLASLGLGWIGEPAFASLLEPVIHFVGIQSPKIIHGIAFFFAFFTISFLHIVVGELAPKSLAIRLPEKISLWAALPLYGFYWAMFPAIWVLNTSSSAVLRLLGLNAGHEHENHYSADEIKLILRSSTATENFSRDEWNILAQTLDFRELEVSDLMRPFSEVIALSRSKTTQENMEIACHHRFSRYPYLDSDGSTMLGMLHLKDLFLAQQSGKSIEDLSKFLLKVEHVEPNMSALRLFRRFRDGAPHFAIVGNKGQRPLGFLTLDNLLSALVGQIRDEFRQTENDWTRLDDGSLIGKGSLPLQTLERALGIDIDNEEVDSVGGLLMYTLGNIPHEGQRLVFDGFSVVVKKMSGPRIVLVRVFPGDANPPEPSAS
ncbi:MAG: HlyC/CorC family transporter [Burkholderiales bacterium]|nr:HlyC/CorC family transporter [Burkholderiales bacterium]